MSRHPNSPPSARPQWAASLLVWGATSRGILRAPFVELCLLSPAPRGESGAYGVAEQLALDVAGSASGKGFWTG
jgi:hypothetical protein